MNLSQWQSGRQLMTGVMLELTSSSQGANVEKNDIESIMEPCTRAMKEGTKTSDANSSEKNAQILFRLSKCTLLTEECRKNE